MKGIVPPYLSDKMVLIPADRARVTRAATRYTGPTHPFSPDRRLILRAAKCWNEFTEDMKTASTVPEFKTLYSGNWLCIAI